MILANFDELEHYLKTIPLRLSYSHIEHSVVLFLAFFVFWEYPLMNFVNKFIDVGFLSYVDEVLLLFIIFNGAIRATLKNRVLLKESTVYVSFIYLTLISLIFGLNRNLIDIVFQNLIHLKFFFFFYYFFFRKDAYTNGIEKTLKLLFYGSLLGVLMSIVLKFKFYDFFGIPMETRNGALRHGGFFKTNFLAFFYLLFYLRILLSYFLKQQHQKVLIVSVLFALLFLILGTRTSIFIIPLSFLLLYGGNLIKSLGMKGLLAFMAFSLIGLLFFSDFAEKTYQNFVHGFDLEGSYIRGIMLHLGGLISLDYFPIGTGSGTFGTIFSEGSIVYDNYGVGHRFFFVNMFGVYDSNLASILGEFGFLGVLIFSTLIYYVFSTVKKQGLEKRFFILLLTSFILNLIVRSLLMNTTLALIFVFGLISILKVNENFIRFKYVS